VIKMKLIAITGGIASGKSSVADIIQMEYEYPVVNMDTVVNSLSERRGLPCFNEIVNEFGSGILTEWGSLNRKKIAEIVFSNPLMLEKLEKILHPRAIRILVNYIDMYNTVGYDKMFVEIPILHKLGIRCMFDEVWVVTIPRPIQLERLMARNHLDKDEAIRRLVAAGIGDVYTNIATRIIDNIGTYEDLYPKVKECMTGSRYDTCSKGWKLVCRPDNTNKVCQECDLKPTR
jgi:dephospho-CoA kinase